MAIFKDPVRIRVTSCRPKERRVCVKEDYTEIDAGGCAGLFRVKKWVFTYSDGTAEAVAVRLSQCSAGCWYEP